MFLRQKLNERKTLKLKINELKENVLVDGSRRDNNLKHLLSLVDKLQSVNLIINQANNSSTIEIAGAKLSISTAIEIRNSLKTRVDVISSLIELNDPGLDIIHLMDQRDSALKELDSIDSAIRLADWNILID